MVTMVTTIAEEIDEFEVKEKGLVGYCVTCDTSVLYDEPHAIQDDTVICLDCIEDTSQHWNLFMSLGFAPIHRVA